MSNPGTIGIIDVGCGNLGNISNALNFLHIEHQFIHDPSRLLNLEKIILPGVGSFPYFMKRLKENGFIDTLYELFEDGRFILGICLGMQVFYEFSEEHDGHDGLSLINGDVRKFDFKEMSRLYKIPHISWEGVNFSNGESKIAGSLFEGIDQDSKYYFLHSFYGKCQNSKNVVGTTRYFDCEFDSVVNQKNSVGIQFHPELSADAGLRLLKNFSALT